jgi:hypothetical protein
MSFDEEENEEINDYINDYNENQNYGQAKLKLLQPDEVDTVLYHFPCSDGKLAALAAWKFFSINLPNKQVDYIPMQIGAPPPPNLEGKNVLICDYSFRKDVLNDLLQTVNKLLIIDHHKSAEKDLIDIDEKYKIFDMDHSGAMLTWFYFFDDLEPPLLFEYVQDRDIWTKALPFTDEFHSWFSTLPMEFSEYDKYMDDDLLSDMIQLKGVAFKELNDHYIKQAVEYAVPKFCKIKDKYYFVAYVNSTILKSDIGHELFQKYPLVDFTAIYSIGDFAESTSFSLRSTKKHADVSEIAFSLGGGGHAEASGVKVPFITNHIPGELYDSGRLYYELQNVYFRNFNIGGMPYSIVYMPSYIYKKELGQYLLQTKYHYNAGGKTKAISVAQSMYMYLMYLNESSTTPKKEDQMGLQQFLEQQQEKCGEIHMSVIWSYDPTTGRTSFSIRLCDSLKKQKSKFDALFSANLDNEIEYVGFFETLPDI